MFSAAPPNGTSYLSDLSWTSVTSGWGPVERDHSNGEQIAGDGHTISIRGATQAKGLGVHAASDVRYDLGGACSNFSASIGIDDEVAPNGSVVFQVLADGIKLYDSGVMTGFAPAQNVTVDISGRNTLELFVTDAGDGIANDHADWAAARVTCGGSASSFVPPPTGSVTLAPGDDIQAAVNSHGTGTTFYLRAGTYRMQRIQPKDGDVFIGEAGAALNGSRLLTAFSTEGSFWVATGQTQHNPGLSGPCRSDSVQCNQPEELFFDDARLKPVSSLSQVGPGSWYFDYSAAKIYIANNPAGHKVETSVTPNAFYGSARNVTIRGLIIEKYASPTESGAVHAMTDPGPYSFNWTVDSNEIRLNHGAGIRTADQIQVLHNNIHHNGESGVEGGGVAILVDNNEIAFNNMAGYDYTSWDGGGSKFSGTSNLVVRNNYVHDNAGPGLWTDGDNTNVLYENNRTSNNRVAGIFHEIGFSTVIRNNTVDRDAFSDGGSLWYGAGIFVASASNVEIYGNTVTNCQNGIGASYVNRGSIGRAYPLQNLNVHDNVIVQSSGTAAGIVSNDDNAFTTWNNRFQNNTYQLSNPNGRYYQWMNGDRTRSEWQSYGQDSSGVWR